MDCVGSITSHSMMRACVTRPSGRGKLPRLIRVNSRRQARQTSDTLTLIATLTVLPQPYFRWALSCLETRVFRKGSPTVTTRLLLPGLELLGIQREMARLQSAADGDSFITRSNSWCLSSFRLSLPSAAALSFLRASLAPHLCFKMER